MTQFIGGCHFPDFESTVNENRDSATEALQNVDDIEKKIGLAAAKTRESFDAMNGADTSANLALTVARDAQQVITTTTTIFSSYLPSLVSTQRLDGKVRNLLAA